MPHPPTSEPASWTLTDYQLPEPLELVEAGESACDGQGVQIPDDRCLNADS